jgi:release factor glutamine methyltransferase
MVLKEALLWAQTKLKDKGITSAPLDAEVLLLEAVNVSRKTVCDKSWLYLRFEKYKLSPRQENIFKDFVARRCKHEPVSYITGRKEFYGLDYAVDKCVLIPRVETELIVDKALSILRSQAKNNFTLLDIGTGSGCIIVSVLTAAVASGLKNIRAAYACDISAGAIRIARKNARQHGVSASLDFLFCDQKKALQKMKDVDRIIITANLPYISPKDYTKLQPDVKRYEPKLALTAGDNGLQLIYRLLDVFAPLSHNTTSFYLLLEADPKQMRSIASYAHRLMEGIDIHTLEDLRGKKRMIIVSKNL